MTDGRNNSKVITVEGLNGLIKQIMPESAETKRNRQIGFFRNIKFLTSEWPDSLLPPSLR
ncbi:hypothetical protein BVY01_02100 [bacterium I07]|nr:hypothetical protein BVY01_02100 [bacterium I07]